MTLLFHIALFILLVFQYMTVIGLLIHQDDLISSKKELILASIPILPIIIFILTGTYALLFDNDCREFLIKGIKKLK